MHKFVIIAGEYFRVSCLVPLASGYYKVSYWLPNQAAGPELREVTGKLNEIAPSWYELVEIKQAAC